MTNGYNDVVEGLRQLKNALSYVPLTEQALVKFPAAKKIAVENFTMDYNSLSFEANMNLTQDQKSYKWNNDTVKAIKWVLNQKNKVKA
jgi:hypothetical protein